jgi:hypothetical protein
VGEQVRGDLNRSGSVKVTLPAAIKDKLSLIKEANIELMHRRNGIEPSAGGVDPNVCAAEVLLSSTSQPILSRHNSFADSASFLVGDRDLRRTMRCRTRFSTSSH